MMEKGPIIKINRSLERRLFFGKQNFAQASAF